jgi:hypothetical protein
MLLLGGGVVVAMHGGDHTAVLPAAPFAKLSVIG